MKICGVCFRPLPKKSGYRYVYFNIYGGGVFIKSVRRRAHNFCKPTLLGSKRRLPKENRK